jgi:hypothetical protein
MQAIFAQIQSSEKLLIHIMARMLFVEIELSSYKVQEVCSDEHLIIITVLLDECPLDFFRSTKINAFGLEYFDNGFFFHCFYVVPAVKLQKTGDPLFF